LGTRYQPPTPAEPGIQVLSDIPLDEIAAYIDWTFFFHAWQLKGRYPQILEDAEKGEEARKLHDDAVAMLHRIISERWLSASAVIGLFPANAVGDDVLVYEDESRTETRLTFHFLRKQGRQPKGRPNECLADFIAPADLGLPDYIGGFACTAGIGIDAHVRRFEQDHDDYSALMLKALADRLAEALAEMLHQRVRTRHWRYASEEGLPNEALIEEQYQGIRPAIGYPACPDHTEKDLLWQLAGRGAQHRHLAHRVQGHGPHGGGLRALFLAPREPLLRRRQDQSGPGGGLCRAQRHDRWPRSSAGWGPTWPTRWSERRSGLEGPFEGPRHRPPHARLSPRTQQLQRLGEGGPAPGSAGALAGCRPRLPGP
jgi:hypothetical protein